MKRHDCEFEIFRSLEEAIELSALKGGFGTISEFIERANSILQRRKSRAGRSLELHVRQILLEEGFREGIDFSYQPESEPGQKPDFLFPSQTAYKNPSIPDHKLAMLAAKTTCKDRWRQILREANRVTNKHLLTLQEGLSQQQFEEMNAAGVQLVVPSSVQSFYSESIRPNLMTFESFIADMRLLALGQ